MGTERKRVEMSIGGRVKIDNPVGKWLYLVDGRIKLGLNRSDVSIYKNRNRATMYTGDDWRLRDFVRDDLEEFGIIDG